MKDERERVNTPDEIYALTCGLCKQKRAMIIRTFSDGHKNGCLFCWTCDMPGEDDAPT